MATSERQLTVRLPEDLHRRLNRLAKSSGIRRSEVVRQAIRRYVESELFENDRPYERVRHLAGIVRDGPPDLGARHREYLLEIFGGR